MSKPGGDGGAREAELGAAYLRPPVTELKKPQMAKNLESSLVPAAEGRGSKSDSLVM